MSTPKNPLADFAPKLVEITETVLLDGDTPTLALVGAVLVAVRMQRQGAVNASRRREAFVGAD